MDKKNRNNGNSTMEQALQNPKLKDQYMREMERVFMGPKGSDKHDLDLQKLHEAYGSASFEKKAAKYIKKYGLPDDWGILLLMLDMKKGKELIVEVMEKLVELSRHKTRLEQKGLKSKLRTLSMVSRDPVVAETAESLIEEI